VTALNKESDMAQKPQELKDLDVERVDGVDKPATGRNFLLFKSKDGKEQVLKADDVMKGYGMVATAANALLDAVRVDKNAVVSRKSAIAFNGLAQVLGKDAVFVDKSVPTQPYMVVEPNVDLRGPADEKLGSNFVARNAEMVDSVSFRMKDDEDDEDGEMYGKGKGKSKEKAADTKDAAKAADQPSGLEAALAKMADGIATIAKSQPTAESIAKAIVAAVKAEDPDRVSKSADADDEPEPMRKSKQVAADDEPAERVRKGAGDYTPRFGVSFVDVVDGRGRKR
jgi:hypothetical protein